MSSVINTNSLSLLTQNNLTKSQSALTSSIQRLSSGLRINSAKDDAAGQAIANRFTASIKGLSQAQRNANDGISLAQTTEGALNEINTNLQRIRELTVQSANGANSTEDKVSIQAEITQRLDEIDRTSQQTDFNGTKVLKNGIATISIQVGASDSQTINIDLKEISKATLGLNGFTVSNAVPTKAATAADLTSTAAAYTTGTAGAAGSTSASAFVAGTSNGTSTAYTQTITTVTGVAAGGTVTFAAAGAADVLAKMVTGGTVVLDTTNAVAADGKTFTLLADGTYSSDLATAEILTAAEMATRIGISTDVTMDLAGDAADVYTIADGATPVVKDSGNATMNVDSTAGGGTTGDLTSSASGVTTTATPTGTSTTTVVYDVNDSTGAVTSGTTPVAVYKDSSVTAGTGNIFTTTASTTPGTPTATPLDKLDKALAIVDDLRGSLGAVQNRFDSVISNLGSTITNLSASRSRIEDADYATEVSNMTRAQILQQAGTSVLAKANQSTEGVMSLLR